MAQPSGPLSKGVSLKRGIIKGASIGHTAVSEWTDWRAAVAAEDASGEQALLQGTLLGGSTLSLEQDWTGRAKGAGREQRGFRLWCGGDPPAPQGWPRRV